MRCFIFPLRETIRGNYSNELSTVLPGLTRNFTAAPQHLLKPRLPALAGEQPSITLPPVLWPDEQGRHQGSQGAEGFGAAGDHSTGPGLGERLGHG